MTLKIKVGKTKIKLTRQEAKLLFYHIESTGWTYERLSNHLTTDGDAIFSEDKRREGIFYRLANAIDEELHPNDDI